MFIVFIDIHKILSEKILTRQCLALRDGRDDEAMRLAKSQLISNPADTVSHFTLAQVYESKKKPLEAMIHVKKCLDELPTCFVALSLAVRCSVTLKNYDDAFQYAEKALKDREEPGFSKGFQVFLKVISYIPYLKGFRDIHDYSVRSYAKQTQWLHEYVVWYNQQEPSSKASYLDG